MTCTSGRAEPDKPRAFESEAELMKFLGLKDDANGRRMLDAIRPDEIVKIERMRAAAEQLERGEIPRGAIGCDRKRRKR